MSKISYKNRMLLKEGNQIFNTHTHTHREGARERVRNKEKDWPNNSSCVYTVRLPVRPFDRPSAHLFDARTLIWRETVMIRKWLYTTHKQGRKVFALQAFKRRLHTNLIYEVSFVLSIPRLSLARSLSLSHISSHTFFPPSSFRTSIDICTSIRKHIFTIP